MILKINFKDSFFIAPCVKPKEKDKNKYPLSAEYVYKSYFFYLNKKFALKNFKDKWFIFSAKYGFMKPSFKIKAPYDITFLNKKHKCVKADEVRKQIEKLKLFKFKRAYTAANKKYCGVLKEPLSFFNIKLIPFFESEPYYKRLKFLKERV